MALLHQALVRLTLPQMDPDDDPVSVSLAYGSLLDGGLTASDTAGLIVQVPHLFNTVAAGADAALCHFMSPSMDRAADHCRIDVYDIGAHLDGTPHGSPVDGGTWTLGATDRTIGLPGGVAATISFRADYGADVEFGAPTGVETGHLRPRSRDRGRIYVGPLADLVVSSPGPTNRCKFTAGFVADCLADLQQVVTISDGLVNTFDWHLSVWSRKNATLKAVVELWMDDRPDYQRRRSDPGVKTFRSAV